MQEWKEFKSCLNKARDLSRYRRRKTIDYKEEEAAIQSGMQINVTMVAQESTNNVRLGWTVRSGNVQVMLSGSEF